MRRLLLIALTTAAAVWLVIPKRPVVEKTSEPLACRWQSGQTFGFDVVVDTQLTFDETALVPGKQPDGSVGRTENASATGRMDAKVVSVTPNGVAVVAARLPDWNADATGAGAYPAIDEDMRSPFLLRIDGRCRVTGTARLRDVSVIAYRRALGVFDRLDFALPAPGTAASQTYTTRQLDDLGWYTTENRWTAGDGRGAIARERLAYDAPPASADGLPVRIRIRSAGGTVDLGDAGWFATIAEHEDVDVVTNGRVPLRTTSTSRITRRATDPHAFDGVTIDVADFAWGRPTDDELRAAHDALRGSELAGVPMPDAVARFTALRDGGTPGAWQDAQRLLRDWMRGNPDGVRELAQSMRDGQQTRKDQADFVLAMAKSRSPVARTELGRLTREESANGDLRVQAASACGDLVEPTPEIVATLEAIASAPRTGTPSDILPSTAMMSLGTIVESAPGTPAAAQARGILQRSLKSGLAVEALYAASNSGDAAFQPASVEYAASTDADERAAAAHAMRKMLPSEVTSDVLDSLMREDVNPEVVKQVAESRRQQLQTYGGSLSDRELALYGGKLPSAPEGVRWELVRTLGQVSTLQPAATAILVDWYRSETSPSLKMLIGQYVPASKLAG